MRKINFLSLAFILMFGIFVSCDKEDVDEQDLPGNIPGMGNAGGELEVLESFDLPEGLSIVSDITGYEGSLSSVDTGNGDFQNLVVKSGNRRCGSGGRDIVVSLPVENHSNQVIPFVIKKGTVFACSEEGYQNAICAKEIIVNIPANSIIILIVDLYCVNQGASGSSVHVSYIPKGVTASLNIMKLVNALVSKQINITDFTDLAEYDLTRIRVQTIIWSLTNGGGISSESWDFIKSLPEAP